jgi:hypothetical protein
LELVFKYKQVIDEAAVTKLEVFDTTAVTAIGLPRVSGDGAVHNRTTKLGSARFVTPKLPLSVV